MAGDTWAIVVAGGDGRRFGRPKQFERVGGRRLLDWALASARAASNGVVAVLPDAYRADPEVAALADRVVVGGATRSSSVRAGLAVVPDETEIVVVHDAARPLASAGLFAAVVAAVRAGADGAVPGLPLVDTVKRVDHGIVVETLDRSVLVAVQTPQAFSAPALRRAHATEDDATDDAALVEALGCRVVVVPGEEANLKVTETADLDRLEALIDRPTETAAR